MCSDEGKTLIPSIDVESPDEKQSNEQRSASSLSKTEAGPSALLAPSKDRRPSRSSSPTQLTRELNIRANTQQTRLVMLQELADQLVTYGDTFCEEEVDCLLSQIDSIFKEFSRQHASLEVSWPASCLPHRYFTDDIFRQASTCHVKGRLVAAKLKAKLKATATPAQASPSSPSSSQHSPTMLPAIQLPKFSGDYAAWPPFRDLFKSLVVDHPEASNINKLHHLKSSLSGEAAQLIASLPMVGDSFNTAWETLNTRYENQRLLIQAQLDKIFGSSTRIQGNSASINQLITTITDAINMLHAVGQSTENWDCVLVYHITQVLDRATKERWENTLGSNTRYPTYNQLMTFLHSRARSLEWIETPSTRETSQKAAAKPSQQQRRSTAVAHAATTPSSPAPSEPKPTTSSDRRTFECDCCSERHFISSCPRFIKLNPKEKLALVTKKDLCTNCFGRHYLRSCRNTHRCRRCEKQHHSMIHEAYAEKQTPTQSEQTQTSTATPANQSQQ